EGAVTAGGDLTAGDDLTINGITTLATGARIFTSTNGDIDLNGAVNSDAGNTWDLTLSALNGTIYAEALGTGTRLEDLVITANEAVLDGSISAETVDTTGVGLTTLAAGTVDIDTTVGAGTVNLGALAGANNLTISAAGAVTLADADIASLDIDQATTVTFNGDFVTSGIVTADTAITGAITVTLTTGSIQAGGAVTLDTSANVDVNGPIRAMGVIAIDADTDITVDANITGTGSNDITLTADSEASGAGDLVIAGDVAATVTTAGDISLTGENVTVGGTGAGEVITTGVGSIIIRADNSDTGSNGNFTIQTAGSRVVSNNNLSVTNAYNVNIGGAGMFANGDISIGGGTAPLGVDNDITISSSVFTLIGGDITMTAGNDVLFDNAAAEVRTTDEGNVSITATAGDILETVADTTVDIAGYQITLSALSGRIGQDVAPVGALEAALEIDSRDWISATTATGSGDIWLAETLGPMFLNNITTGDDTLGVVTLEALDTAGTQIDNGAIEDALISTIQVTAGSLRLDAKRGIGMLDTLNTDVSTLAAQTEDYGIYIQNIRTPGLTIGTVNGRVGVVVLDAAGHDDGDDINIRSDSPLTVNDVVTNNDGGDITLAAEGTTNGDDLTINADITAAGGDGYIYLYAGDTITQGATADVTAATSGYIYYYAGIDYNNGNPQRGLATGASDITMTSGATATSTSGDITMYAPRDIYLSALTTTGDVIITADYSGYTYGDLNNGAIIDNLAAETANITAATATLRAATGIGSAGDIDTTITTLDALNSTSGNLLITELDTATGDLDVNQATQSALGNLLVQTEDGTLTVVADQSGVATTTGTLQLIAGNAGLGYTYDLVINDTVTSTTGNVTLTSSGDDVRFGAGGDVTTTSGTVDVNAESGALGGAGVIFMADGAVINSGTAQTDMDAYGDITLGSVQTTYTTDDAIAITSAAGGIIDGGDTDVDIIANTASATVDLDAVTGIGSTNALETSIYNLEALNTTSGNIKINEADAINLTHVINQAIGSVEVTAEGTITTTEVTASNGAVSLYAVAGDILDTAGALITAGATSNLRAGGIIGTTTNPLDVNINGTLWVWTAGQQDEVSAILSGTVSSGAHTERVEILEPSPPGLVILDNHLMGGGNYGSGSANGSILSRGYGQINTVLADMIYAFYQMNLEPWGHKMMIPWVLSEGAKIDNDFLSSLPAIIDISQLNLPALQMELNKTPDYFVIRSLK
ncbi:MAG: hypothetical protein WC723_02920, partial [Candidatus Omnitrophota bacterium]